MNRCFGPPTPSLDILLTQHANEQGYDTNTINRLYEHLESNKDILILMRMVELQGRCSLEEIAQLMDSEPYLDWRWYFSAFKTRLQQEGLPNNDTTLSLHGTYTRPVFNPVENTRESGYDKTLQRWFAGEDDD